MPITEWEFTADVASRINELIQASAIILPFGRAKVEQRGAGSRKRRDLTVLGRDGAVLITGEVKMPWAAEGHSPFVYSIYKDARQKAERARAPWFFTWNVNELVLWVTRPQPGERTHEPFRRYQVATIGRESDFNEPYFVKGLKDGINAFLIDFAKIVLGEDVLPRRAPDDYFVESLESFLEGPIQVAYWTLVERYKTARHRDLIDHWMLKDQGWTLAEDTNENLRRVARATTYAVANKLVFYEALRKTFGRLPRLSLPLRIKTGEQAFDHLIAFFARAKDETRDYETVFGFEAGDFATRVPFYAESGMDGWRSLIDHIEKFDFSKLDYDVIGRIFERLIGPEERHKYGQYYTRPEVVDLINSFCITDATATVLDPACGGGTFLVRAYARKRVLAPQLGHVQRLSGIYGIDISPFAAQLTTINLASRDLVQAENYPRVIRSDFFDVRPGGQFMVLPGLGTRQGRAASQRIIPMEPVDAVVGNPPYVRQENIRKARNGKPNDPPPGTKEFYRRLVQSETGIRMSGRADLHCYFWGHGSAFLRPTGRLGFLTSSQWLDVEYGFPLQRWLLENFRIVAVFESRVEPWFVGARVVTAITIAYREPDHVARDENIVRFVELRRPLGDLLLGDGTSAGMIEAADRFRNVVINTARESVTDSYRIRLVPQGQLRSDGVALGRVLARRGRSVDPDDDTGASDEVPDATSGEYYGGKWGLYLRAPDLWFRLLDSTRKRWVRLSEIAEVRFGVKTGADDFFYVRDVTDECLGAAPTPPEFLRSYHAERAAAVRGSVKLIKTGTGEIFAIESEFLEPVILSTMEIDGYEVTEVNCSHRVLMVGRSKRELRRTRLARYIERGEQLGYHLRPSCSGRVINPDLQHGTRGREWFDLTAAQRAPILWVKERQYRHSAPINPSRFVANCRLYEIESITDIDDAVLAGILNSSLCLLSLLQFGRPVGVEGNWSTMVLDVNMMLVPDPRGTASVQSRVKTAFAELAERKAMSFVSDRRRKRMALTQKGRESEIDSLSDETELDQNDRRALDDAVLELLGIEDRKLRLRLLDELYAYLREHFEEVRKKEEEAIQNKKRTVHGSRQTPDEIAAGLLESLKADKPELLNRFRDLMTAEDMEHAQGVAIPDNGRLEIVDDMVTTGVRFATGKGRGCLVQTENREQAELMAFVAQEDGFGRHEFFPVEAGMAARFLRSYKKLAHDRRAEIRRLVESRTANSELQEQIVEKIQLRLRSGWR